MNLIDKISDINNLKLAWKYVKGKKKAGGIDRQSLADFGKNSDTNLQQLSSQLKKSQYVPEPSLIYKIPKSHKRYREICLITIKDKIAQKAAVNIIQPMLEKKFSSCSYAYRPGKGHQKALKRILHIIQYRKMTNFLTADIRNYFDSVPHKKMIKLIRKHISNDEEFIKLIKLWLKMGKISRKQYKDNQCGLPQGFILSPLLSNLYLNEFDHMWQKNKIAYIRYADNFIWAAKAKKSLSDIFNKAKHYLLQERNLYINYSKYQFTTLNKGFVFLGIFFKDTKLKIANRKMDKANRKIKRIANNKRLSKVQKIEKMNQATYAWHYYYRIVTKTDQKEILDYWIVKYLRQVGFNRDELYRIRYLSKHFRQIIAGRIKFNKRLQQLEKDIRKNPDSPENRLRNQLRNKRKFYKKKLNLDGELLIIKQGTRIGLHQNGVAINRGNFRLRIPLQKIKAIQIPAKRVSITTNIISKCSKFGIPIFISDNFGNPLSQILPNKFTYLKLIMQQVKYSKGKEGMDLAKRIVEAKIKNQKKVIQYFGKYWAKKSFIFQDELKQYKSHIKSINTKIKALKDSQNYTKMLMGYEGSSASLYWNLFGRIIKKNDFRRKRYGAKDIINSMINYGYGILYHRLMRKIVGMGLNPCCGFLHKYEKNRPSLVFDLIEPFRAIAVDRVVISTINKKIKLSMNTKGFFDYKSRRKIAHLFLDRLHNRFNYKDSDTSIMEQIELLVVNYAKSVKGKTELDPFIWFY